MHTRWIVVLLAVGCGQEEKPEDTDSAPPLVLDDTADCNLTAPVITDFVVGDGGIIDDPDQGKQQSVKFEVSIDDEDGDLDVLTLKVWYDEAVDGTVDTSGAPAVETAPYQVRDEPCNVYSADFSLRWGVTGSALDFATTYDFAAVALDSHGAASAPAFATGTTPEEDTSI